MPRRDSPYPSLFVALTPQLSDALQAEAQITGLKPQDIGRVALAEYLTRRQPVRATGRHEDVLK
jgi:hypothetical protein